MHTHKHLAPIFAEARTPKHIGASDTHKLLVDVLDLASRVQQQVALHRQLLLAAEMQAPDPTLTASVIERLHQTLGHIDLHVDPFIKNARQLAVALRQYERYSSEIEAAHFAALPPSQLPTPSDAPPTE